MDIAPDGTLFTGSKNGTVYADAKDRHVTIIDRNPLQPAGVDFYRGYLYVSGDRADCVYLIQYALP
jgi:hypothetical protein